MYFFERFTMEETFIVTYIGVFLLAILVAVPLGLIFEKDGRNEDGK